MRKIRFVQGEYYHIYNRGNNRQMIFLDNHDYIRFLFLILYFQSPFPINNMSYAVSNFIRHRVSDSSVSDSSRAADVAKNRAVELVSFTQMPNHFHLIVRELKNNGISLYMQRVLNAHTKYLNTKYSRSGHLFQGPFQAVHIGDNEQLMYLSAYIHRNQRDISKWKDKEHLYPWSSYQDYIKENRWGNLLCPEIILNQYKNQKEYKNFVKTSGAKDKLEEELLIDLL